MKKERNIFKKGKHVRNFSMIDNQIFKSGLSVGAIGILVVLLSKPEDWIITKSYFMNNHNVTRRDIDKIFIELEDNGFVTKESGIKTKENQSGIIYYAYEESIKI